MNDRLEQNHIWISSIACQAAKHGGFMSQREKIIGKHTGWIHDGAVSASQRAT